jgi:acetyl esterase
VRAVGGKAFSREETGLVHGYLRARHTVERARVSFTRIVDAVRALGKGQWPY